MRVRALDSSGDWTYGKGRNNYKTGNAAVVQAIQCNLYSFLGDCFFATTSGIDWFNLLGGKDQTALNLAIAAAIINTDGVTGLLQLSVVVNSNRNVTIQYKVQTIYSQLTDTFVYDSTGVAA